MKPEEFMKRNPFPINGTEINNDLVKAIQDPEQVAFVKRNTYKLFKNNARLIAMVYKQFNYNQELSAIMSFVYEGIESTSKTYRLDSKMPYYSYAITHIRALLQKYYNYNESTVHVPVKKRKEFQTEYAEVNDYNEHIYGLYNEVEDPIVSELEMLLIEYESLELSDKQREELEIVKLSRYLTTKEISQRKKIGVAKVRTILKNIIPHIQRFYHRNLA
jgi:hypothetical protein